MQGGDLASESILPCVAAVVGQPDPSKGPRESCEWLGNDLAEDHVDGVENVQLQHLIPVRLSLQHHRDRHRWPVNDLKGTDDDDDDGEGVELEEEETCQA